jgi:hypothetical protein
MTDLAYWEVTCMIRNEARYRLVITAADARSVSKTAGRWATSRQVVRKWLTHF